ncbi:hypothetical protein LWI29_022699 [Acer saccharum]|uniref:Reverse transcriptase/retrotransposon-derived protein RNase H-like domain-containing protein n=1 Tax=Acer saccharum TaxID=4024 RepID=A0AA39VBJ1_ACESA|nr:hypothetical protein LWI29_022699 [Acer saccharum]
MEVYVDYMITKSHQVEQHLDHLRETFEVLQQNQMRLNPDKCAFGVSTRKVLGFMVHERGIEANPEKIKAILELQSPTTLKQVQGLTGRLAALNRFISRSTDRCLPFFQVIKKGRGMNWDEESKRAFRELQSYLTNPPLLVKPLPGDILQLYLAVSSTVTSAALVKECEGGIQRPIYYVSRSLSKAEKNYNQMEKLAFALVVVVRKLRPYFQAHSVTAGVELLVFGSISGGMVDSGSGGRMVDSGSSGMEVVNSVSYGRIGVSKVSSQKLHSCMAEFSP